MKEWISNYIRECVVCQQNKIMTHKKKILLYWIRMDPNACPFESIAMDLITGLPPKGHLNTILTIVDQGCS
jgi:hypothetical protein